MQKSFRLTFWGVRGSIPVAKKEMMKFGGNTPCIEMEVDDQLLIFDAGSGIIPLGEKLVRSVPKRIHLFFSHVHWDHIQGFPFFAPAYCAEQDIYLYGESKSGMTIEEQLGGLMREPYWPIGLNHMNANLIFHTIEENDCIQLGSSITVTTIRGNHPGGTLLYKISNGEKSVCIVSDYEHGESIDPALVQFVQDADVLIYDAFYTNEEFYDPMGVPIKKGWGHSTWQEGCRLAQVANVNKLFLFHHDIRRTDDQLVDIEKEAQKCFLNTFAACEGSTIDLYTESR